MTLNLFAPPTTNWTVEAPRRMAETRGMYEAAIRDTRGDALGAARSMAGTGSGAAASRTALQAVAPAVADLRRQQILASQAMGNRLRAEQLAERERSSDFMNNLFGGISGIAGQMMVPLIGGLGSGGNPTSSAAGPVMSSAMAPRPMPMAGAPPAAVSAPAATAAPAGMAPSPTAGTLVDPATGHIASDRMIHTAAAPAALDPFAEEERRRRGSLGSLFGTAAPIAGMVNPLAGLGVGMAGRLFG